MRAALEPFVGTAVDLRVPPVDAVVFDPARPPAAEQRQQESVPLQPAPSTSELPPTRVLARWRRIRTSIWAGGGATILAIGIVAQQVASRPTGPDGVSTPAPVAQCPDVPPAAAPNVRPTDVPPTA